MYLHLRIAKCLQGIVKRKAVILLGLILLSFTSFKASAHAVQVGYVILPNGFIRVYIEHWHGALSTGQLVGNGMNISTTYGTTTVTQNLNPTGAFNGYNWNNLPGAGANIIILATSGSANGQHNWAYYDFAPAACNVPVKITLLGGVSVVLTESEPQIWPQTISGTFVDNSAPTITPSNTSTTVACGVSGAKVNFSATAIDNCTPNPAVTFSVPPGSFFPVGTTPVTAYSSDANGNSGQLTFNVTVSVLDNVPPVISCPANISVGTDLGSCSAIVNYALPAYSDNCGIATIQQIGGLPSGANFPKGNTTNTFRVKDGSGNSATCSFVVTVADKEAPTARCQTAFAVIDANGNAGITVADINNGSYDNCGGITVSITSGQTSYSCVDAGKTFPVTILVTDAAGNTSSCTAQVVVTDPNSVCNHPPVAVCKAVTVSADSNCQGTASATAFDGGSTDADAGDVLTFSVAPAGPYAIGTTNVTLTVTDSKGASSSCTTTITVVDDTKPTITAPAAIAVNNDPGQCGAKVDIGTPATGDNCAIATTVNDHPSATYPVGTTTVTWTVTDIHGNSSTATQIIVVTDNEKPTITAPAAIAVNNDPGQCGAKVDIGTATTGDNCAVGTTVNDHPSATYPVGTTTVTWTVTDIHGNSSTATQTVTVTDKESPKANCKPVTIILVNSAASITAASVDNNSTDNCGITSITVSKSTFNCSNIGANSVTLTVTDIYGNVSTCNATVTVVGEIPTCSIASVPTSSTYTGGVSTNLYLGYGAQSTTLKVTPAANGAPYTYSWSGPVSLLSSSTSAAPVFTPVTAGTYTFMVVTTNVYGCTTTCSITICVTDIRVPGTNGSKVYVCHLPPGNTGNPQTLSISVNAVPSHLGNHTGDRLGSCAQKPCSGVASNSITQSSATSQSTKEMETVISEETFTVKVAPNPSTNYFTLKLVSKYETPVSMRVLDPNGRVLDAKSGIGSNSTVQVGHNYIGGTYYAELIQGTTRKVVQLIKVGK